MRKNFLKSLNPETHVASRVCDELGEAAILVRTVTLH